MKHLILTCINKERNTYQAKSFACSSLIDSIFNSFNHTKQQHAADSVLSYWLDG